MISTLSSVRLRSGCKGNSLIVDYYDYVDADVVLDLEMIVVQLIMMMVG